MIKRLRRLIPRIKQSKHTSEKPVGTSQFTDHTEAVLMKPLDMFQSTADLISLTKNGINERPNYKVLLDSSGTINSLDVFDSDHSNEHISISSVSVCQSSLSNPSSPLLLLLIWGYLKGENKSLKKAQRITQNIEFQHISHPTN